MLEQIGEGMVDWLGIDHVVIIKNEDKIVRNGGNFIEKSGQDRLGWWRLRGLEHSQYSFPDFNRYRL